MDSTEFLENIQARLGKLERQLTFWRFAAAALCVTLVLFVAFRFGWRVEAQSKSVVPLTIWSADGQRPLFSFLEWQPPNAPYKGATLAFFQNGKPSVYLAAAGETYKDTTQPGLTLLNELQTWTVDLQNGGPTPYKVSSLALTSSGGSLIMMRRPLTANTQETHAARLTAQTGSGEIILYQNDGKTESFRKP